jgi:transposase
MAGGRLVAQDGDIAEVEAPEELVARVAAIDVAKASGMVCTRVPHPAKPGQRATKVWQVPATTNAIIELAEQLACQGIQRVVVESTSDSWRPFVYLLEPAAWWCGWSTPATSSTCRAAPRPTSWMRCGWPSSTSGGMLRPSFVPAAQIRQLREDTRLRSDLTGDRARQVQRLEQAAGWTP